MDLAKMAREFLDTNKRWFSWATLDGVSHAWERFPFIAVPRPALQATICGKAAIEPTSFVMGPTVTRCPECARIDAEPLTALLQRVYDQAKGGTP